MIYQTFEPAEDLRALVKCYWTLDSQQAEDHQRQTIVPDGCMEMIFHLGDLYKQYVTDDKWIIQPRCFVIGQLTQPLEIEPTGTTAIFSVRFHPQGFSPLATIPVKEMENTAVSLDELFDADGIQIERAILNATSTDERIALIERFIKSRLVQSATIDFVVKSTVETILTASGQLTVHELSEQVKLNRRQLERKFASAIGLSPKQLMKTIRLQATLKQLLNNQFTSLTALAYEGAYYDQAHFIKDFKEFTGLTPKEFYGDSLKMSTLFVAD